ncbi:MAG: hypothetical protein ABH951_02670 [Patescibacteria group bacterium]
MSQDSKPLVHDKKHNIGMAVIAYILFFVPLLSGDAKKDAFVKYHTKQGLALFLTALAINIISWIIPFYFWWTISNILSLGILVLLIIGISNAVSGKKRPLPIIGKFADFFKF